MGETNESLEEIIDAMVERTIDHGRKQTSYGTHP